MCHLVWRWNKALNDSIRLFSSSLWCYRPRSGGRLSSWVHKVVLQYIISHHFMLQLL